MASDFPIQYYTGTEVGPMNHYFTPDTDADFDFNDLVVFDPADQTIDKVSGADPALILGIAKGGVADKFLWQDRVPVSVLTSSVQVGLCVTGTLAATDQGIAYGIVETASGNISVDLSDTVNTRFLIVTADVPNQIAWGFFIAANLQADAIAS